MSLKINNKQNLKKSQLWLLGIAFTFLIALLGFLLSLIPGFNNVVSLLNEILRWISYGVSDLVDNFISLKIVKSFKDQR